MRSQDFNLNTPHTHPFGHLNSQLHIFVVDLFTVLMDCLIPIVHRHQLLCAS
jgi:hypothetical protein